MKRHVVMSLSNAFRPDPRVLKEAISLVQAGWDVTVICWDRKKEFPRQENIEGIAIRRLWIRSGYGVGSRQILHLPFFWYQSLKEMSALRPDIIHCHDLDTTPAGYYYSHLHRIPWIYDAHECYPVLMRPQVNRIIYHLLLVLERFVTRNATHVLTVGETHAQRFRSLGGQISVVGNYAPLNIFDHCGKITRSALGLSPDDFLVAYIGGFTRGRAILPIMKATGIFQDVTLLLVGNGPQRGAIEAELPRHRQVRYLGWVSQEEALEYTSLADVIYYGLDIHDPNSEFNAPNTLFHALTAGKPILTTNVGEIGRIVREEQCGIALEEASPDLLAMALEQLSNPVFRLKLARNARQAAVNKYNWNIAQENLLNVYQELASRRGI